MLNSNKASCLRGACPLRAVSWALWPATPLALVTFRRTFLGPGNRKRWGRSMWASWGKSWGVSDGTPGWSRTGGPRACGRCPAMRRSASSRSFSSESKRQGAGPQLCGSSTHSSSRCLTWGRGRSFCCRHPRGCGRPFTPVRCTPSRARGLPCCQLAPVGMERDGVVGRVPPGSDVAEGQLRVDAMGVLASKSKAHSFILCEGTGMAGLGKGPLKRARCAQAFPGVPPRGRLPSSFTGPRSSPLHRAAQQASRARPVQ